MLSATNLHFIIDNRVLLQDISFNLPSKRLYGLIGHNGSGKSTLIKILSGELLPTAGQVTFEQKPIHSFAAKDLAKHIAYLPQHLPDAADFLVKELVMLGRFPWQRWLQRPTAEDQLIVQRAMEQTAVMRFAEQPVNTLSGGERQRVWLAMCLAQQSQYLLLDEPLAALDIVYQVEIMQLIRRLVDQQELTVVIIMHDINLAAQYCDDIIALKSGLVCHHAAVENIMQVDVLKDIFNVNFSLLEHPVNKHRVAVV